MKKLLALLLAILMLIPALAACKKDPEDPSSPSDNGGTDPSAPTPSELVILQSGEETSYKLIYAESLSSDVILYVRDMVTKINDKFPGVLLLESSDYASWEEAPTGTLEILIGATNRPESQTLKNSFSGLYQYGIQVFENGRVAIHATNDRMLQEAIAYFLKTYVTGNDDGVLSLPVDLNYLYNEATSGTRKGWQLSVPAYLGGVVSSSAYNNGPGLTITAESALSRMQAISGTNRAEYDNYLETLAANGYTEIAKTEFNGNVFAQYKNKTNNRLVYAYLWAALNEVRVIEDKASVAETDFEYTYTPAAGEETAIYQYAMMYNRNGNGNQVGDPYPNCGMFYIVRLADNKLILIDGGASNQATDAATAELMKFMREITGKSETEKVDIAAVLISHAHGDHKTFVEQLVNKYSTEINIERAVYNLPNWDYGGFTALGKALKEKFPNIKFIKPHAGQNLQLGNISIDIITTHEDIVDADTGATRIIDFNSTSTVYRLNVNNKTIMIMGDWGGGDTRAPADYAETERRLLAVYANATTGESYLKSDIIQIAHHALNPYMENINKAIAAKYAFFPAADVALASQAHPNVVNVNYNQFIAAGGVAEQVYFSSRYTYCLAIAQDGTITVAAQNIRGADTGDNPNTTVVEQDYVNVTLKAYKPYRVPTEQEFTNWNIIHGN